MDRKLNRIYLPFYRNFFHIEVTNSRRRLSPANDIIENVWTYELIIDEHVGNSYSYMYEPIILEDLQKCISQSSITTSYRWNQSQEQDDLMTKVDIISVNFDWLHSIDEYTIERFLYIMRNHKWINKLIDEVEKSTSLTTLLKRDTLLTKFIAMVFLQIIDYYTQGYDCGKVKKQITIQKPQDSTENHSVLDIWHIMEYLSLISSVSNETCVFTLNSELDTSCYITCDFRLNEVALELESTNFPYWKVSTI